MKRAFTLLSYLLASALAGIFCTTSSLAADAYPNRTVRIIDAFPPGGSTDVLARLLSQELSSSLGQPFVVENRPGAAGNIGTDHVAKSKPDGYTLGIAPNQTVSVNPTLYPKLPFDVRQDLTGVGMLARVPMILVVKSESKINSIDDLITAARANPSQLTFASAGAGSPHHMSAEIFKSLTDTDMTHVPYKGSAPALIDVLSGNVDIMFCPMNSALPYVQNGRLKALGVTSTKRLAVLPDVPSIAEKVPHFESDIWIGMVTGAKTPPAVIDKLNTELHRVLTSPAIKQTLAKQGIEAELSTVDEFNQLIESDRKRWGEVIRRASISVN